MGALSIEQVLTREAEAIHGLAQVAAVDALRGLAEVQAVETDRADKDADTRSGRDEDPNKVDKREAFYCALNNLNRAALCFSGGGIRSATFCLGVIQALAMHGLPAASDSQPRTLAELAPDEVSEYANRSLLSRFHYLSTVSGGGYIGSWLSAWRNRNDFPTVWQSLASRPDGPDVEPAEISWLRAYSSYLTPRVGLFSADTWTAAAIFLRNLILNWLVIVPALAVVVLILKLLVTLSVEAARTEALWLHFAIALVGVAFLIVAQGFTTRHRPTRRSLTYGGAADSGNVDQNTFLFHNLIWSLLSAVFITSFLTSIEGVQIARGLSTPWAIAIGAGLGVAIFAAGWLAGWPLSWKCKDLGLWAASGSVYGGLLGLGAHLFLLLSPYTYASTGSIWVILIPVIIGVPWVLTAQLFAELIFVGLVSYEFNSDADREWLGRVGGWVATTAVIWMVATFIVFAGGHFLIDTWGKYVAPYIASAGGIAGVIGAWIGKSSQTPAKAREEKPGAMALAAKFGLALAGPIFAAVLIVGISVGLDLLLLDDSLLDGLAKGTLETPEILLRLGIGLAATLFVATVASKKVNINRFSIHALYRNRLVRAYLGASRQKRSPDLFTGFDAEDNLSVNEIWPPKKDPQGRNTFCLFHVVNITLNIVKATRLAWQQRKAESFTVSPLHSGTAYKGFRPSKEYGGGAPWGISLGTAMAISGAAASPNMGYHSSPGITLLLALFNVRLGWWLGNPGKEGEKTYKEEGPATAIRPLAEETFGLTTDTAPWVYLSDGGHFENLGLYEMVRRRCRFILVVDAGCDPKFEFEDLGNAVRKIFIDLGVRVRFQGLDLLKTRPEGDSAARDKIPYHAVGKIHYRDADGPNCQDGWILYVKPAVHFTDGEGAGVRSYANASKTFPHESTADQFFTESQFESYRSLGLDVIDAILRKQDTFDHGSLEDLLAALAPTVHA